MADDAEGAGVGVNQAGRHAGCRGGAEIPGGFRRQGAESVAIGVAVGGYASAGEEIGEAHGFEEVALPAGGFVGNVASICK